MTNFNHHENDDRVLTPAELMKILDVSYKWIERHQFNPDADSINARTPRSGTGPFFRVYKLGKFNRYLLSEVLGALKGHKAPKKTDNGDGQ